MGSCSSCCSSEGHVDKKPGYQKQNDDHPKQEVDLVK